MKLRLDTVVRGVEKVIADDLAPLLGDPFAQDAARRAQALLAIVRTFRDDEVALKVAEHDRLRAIFADAASIVCDDHLAARLKQAIAAPETALTHSALDIETGRLRSLLVDLHAHAEDQGSESAAALCRRIWTTLREIEAGRTPRA